MSNALITRDYNGVPFVFREDGYFNMTKAAAHFGKDLSNFMRSRETAEYLEALSNSLKFTDLQKRHTGQQIGGNPHDYRSKALIVTVPGNRFVPDRGTWAHPKLAVFFARWLDVRFAVWCDMMIDDVLTKKAEVTIVKPQEPAVLQASTADVMLFIQQLAQGKMFPQQQIAAVESKVAAMETTVTAKLTNSPAEDAP